MIIKKKDKTPILPPDEKEMTVKLRNCGGIPPSVYLRIFLGFAAACGLFFLLIYPGIRKEGTILSVTTVPSGAVVTVNDYYAGTSPAEVFLPAHTVYHIKIEKPGFPIREQTVNARGRLLGTLFFPVREKINITWEKPESTEICYRRVLAEFNDFALADDEFSPSLRKQTARSFEPNYFFTETLVFFVKDFRNFLSDSEIESVILRCAGLCTHEVTANAVLKAYTELFPKMNAEQAAEAILTTLGGSHPRCAVTFGNALPSVLKEKFESLIHDGNRHDYQKPSVRPSSSFNALGERWVFFPETAVMTEPTEKLPAGECRFGGFWIQDREVTAGLFRQFLKDHPEFDPEKSNEWETSGTADAFYMRYFPSDNRLPAVSVSWHAAQAFCRWIEQQPELAGYSARLPYSYEIEILTADDNPAISNLNSSVLKPAGQPQADTLRDLTGNVWEWCQNPPLRDPAESDSLMLNLPTEIKAVKGGSCNSETFSPGACGAQFALWSSPYTGFRIVLESK